MRLFEASGISIRKAGKQERVFSCPPALLIQLLPFLLSVTVPVSGADKKPVSFRADIAPILLAKCQACHGEKSAKGNYRLDTYEALMAGKGEGRNVITGKPVASKFHQLLMTKDADDRMPQKADPLPPAQIELVKRWIEQGAKFDGADPKLTLAELVPPREHAPAPKVYAAAVPITALTFSPDGKELAASGFREITVWDAASGQLLRRIGNVAARTYALAWSTDGKRLAAGSGIPGELGEARLFEADTGKLLKVFGAHGDVVQDVKFSPDGQFLATASADGTIALYDASTGARRRVIANHADAVTAIAFSPDGKRLASASLDKSAKVFDLSSGVPVSTYIGHEAAVYGVVFGEAKQVFTAGRDRKVHVWNPDDGKKASDIKGFGHEVFKLVATGDALFSCSADGAVRQHTLPDRKEQRIYSSGKEWLYSLSVHEATKRVAAGGFDGQIWVWSTADGAAARRFVAAPGLTTASN